MKNLQSLHSFLGATIKDELPRDDISKTDNG